MYRIGIDIGGTFTDLVAIDDAGAVTFVKYPTTPGDQSIGLVEGLEVLAAELGITRDKLLTKTALIIHGTTVATNALLERKGSRVGMLTTAGFRDVIEQREGLKPERYNVRLRPEPVLVPRARRLSIRERIRFDGKAEAELDEASVYDAIETLKNEDVNAVAVCCLHSYSNPGHERRIDTILKEKMPTAYVCLSADVLPQIKEFERFSTTVVNAFVGPILSNYMKQLRHRLGTVGYDGDVLIMQSHGGLATVEDSVNLGAGCVLSGPAGGIAGARYAAKVTGVRNLITFDMGGTSSDIALLNDGEASFSSGRLVQGTLVALPSIDIHTIGAGGGSIATVEIGGILRVGPESAGSDPGPACYSRGGVRTTTTDANVVLGFYNTDNFLGGRISFDGASANKAISKIADELGVTVLEAAEGILGIINTQMAEGIRMVAVRAGGDPRSYALLSFGGAAGLHVTAIAKMLGVKRVLIPRTAAVFSAMGMLATDLQYDFVRTKVGDVRQVLADELRKIFSEMECDGRRRIERAGLLAQRIEIVRSLDMRYGEQIFEINVPMKEIDPGAGDVIEQIIRAFHQRHEELYTYSLPDQEVVLVNVRLSALGIMKPMLAEVTRGREDQLKPTALRRVYLGKWMNIPVYNMDGLAPLDRIDGPAIVESSTTTVLLRKCDRVNVTAAGWLDIEIQGTEATESDAQNPAAPKHFEPAK
jgi:N-methylhydantoinase A